MCYECHKPVITPDCFWHPWIGYIHRTCWKGFVDG